MTHMAQMIVIANTEHLICTRAIPSSHTYELSLHSHPVRVSIDRKPKAPKVTHWRVLGMSETFKDLDSGVSSQSCAVLLCTAMWPFHL